MVDKSRVLNNMPGFKRGFQAVMSQQNFEDPDDQVAFVLGALAGVYNSIEDKDNLWEVRQKIWKIEEALGQSRETKMNT